MDEHYKLAVLAAQREAEDLAGHLTQEELECCNERGEIITVTDITGKPTTQEGDEQSMQDAADLESAAYAELIEATQEFDSASKLMSKRDVLDIILSVGSETQKRFFDSFFNYKEATPQTQAQWLEDRIDIVNRVIQSIAAGLSLELPTPRHAELIELHRICKKFVDTHEIYCAEKIYGSDKIIENAYDLIQKICSCVGYYKEEEKE